MLIWYEDNYLGVFFNETPRPDVLFPLPSMTKEEKENIQKKPFINKKELKVKLIDYVKLKTYNFTIEKDYRWDGATIPRAFWRLIGAKTDPKFLIPSMIHDVLCENHNYVDCDRYFADKIFERLLYISGVPALNRFIMFHSVDNFQKMCGWRKKEK